MRIYFFFFCPRTANLLSLFYTGKGFFLFFCFSVVGHGFLLLIIEEEGRGGEEEKRGWKRMEEETGKRGWLCALGAEHVGQR